jgi:3-hydroxybutyryl-CoA dehydrogenase
MKMKIINNVVVVGAGIMGQGIAQVFAQGGKNTILIDSYKEALEAAPNKIKKNLKLLMANGLLKTGSLGEIFSLIEFTADLNRAKDADIIIEAIPEKFVLKERLFKDLETLCRSDTILATNTSGIPITKLAGVTRHPERVIGTHFYMPAQLIPLVEIIQTEQTNEAVIQQTVDLMTAVGKNPVRVRKDVPGFIGNRLQHAIAREAISLIQKGVATPEDIDTVVRSSLAIRFVFTGPIEQRDFNGLDTHLSIAEYLYSDLEDAKEPLAILRERVEAGDLGLKTGRGFYDWSEENSDAVIAHKNQELINLIKFMADKKMLEGKIKCKQ